ncbi:Barstar (barnase inhibitor) [Friedmanniella luteola]|uniref:Barstar (Barnase inhibitor) n=1 Tax=Friedmanniella luteola TaxID=546871 RepID=A0A1H1P9J8_9ACTN|nr:barstar family protein [Friedmanniella luteola]SDS07794.1 Barstar (barnase inhibitor) [Friedmanniella luteola]
MTGDRPPLTPGVYRMADAATVAQRLASSGWDARPVGAARTTPALYASLAAALALPSWFGANLDALWDCLADLDRPTALVLAGWDGFARAQPRQARRLLELFAERAAQDPPFVVVLAAG